jgi:hypothetical protein
MSVPDPLPQQPQPVTAGAIPWYKSPIIIGAATVLLGAAATLFPSVKRLTQEYQISATDILEVVGAAATLIGSAIIGIRRWLSTLQPITWTKKGAATHPSTQAIIATQARMAAANIPTAVQEQQTIINASKPATAPTSGDPK